MWESMFGVSKSAMDSMIMAQQQDPEAYEKMMNSLYGGGGSIPIAEAYDFESRLAYKLTTESGKKSNSMDYMVLINPETKYMATRLGSVEENGKKSDVDVNVTTIMDYGRNAMVMIMEEQKMATVMSMNIVNAVIDTAEIAENNVKIEKSGKTKDILGYSCDEYLMKSDDVEGSVWIAKDMDVASKAMFQNMGNSSFAKNSGWLDEKGMMMEMDMLVNEENSKKPSHMKMTLTGIDEEKSHFNMSDYQTMSFGGTTTK
jgi:cellobiose-specific phosphotransferase system component IIB